MIQRPEPLQETVNAEMVMYLDNTQKRFLEIEVAESVEDRGEYLKDVALAYNVKADAMVREEAIQRIKKEVLRHGVWVGHGDLLTVKMFYTAKSLRYALLSFISNVYYVLGMSVLNILLLNLQSI